MSRRAQGAGIITDPNDSRPVEMDSFTCCHCQKVVWMHDRTGKKLDPGGFCMSCFAQICPRCSNLPCAPFLKKLEAYEKQVAANGQLFRALR